LLALAGPLAAQQNPDLRVESIEIRPSALELAVGERVSVEITPRDAEGRPVPDAQLMVWTQGSEISFDPKTNEVVGVSPGHTTLDARVRRLKSGAIGFRNVWGHAAVTVHPAPVERVELAGVRERVFAGTTSRLRATAYSGRGIREDAAFAWRSSNPKVLRIERGGVLDAFRPGEARITVSAEGVEASATLRVVENPVRQIMVARGQPSIEVGRVLHLGASALNANGTPVTDAEIHWSGRGLSEQPYDAIWLEQEGSMGAAVVLQNPGLYRFTARVGERHTAVEIQATARPPRRRMKKIAHGVEPRGQSTTDLWVFPGLDGRDYVYTGTYDGNLMYAWDVTDPSHPTITDSVAFNGRRVNDVKINAARTLAVVTSEHASDRRNGITVLDIADPAHPKKVSHFTDGLTGGVHNVWIEGDLVYAVHYGTRDLHIIDISDPAHPRRVGRWGLAKDDRFLHDVTVKDGLAYLAYWNDGVVILDVGAGIAGGTPTDPKLVSQYRYSYKLGSETYGNTHHVIRYGKYVFAGDEIFGCGECTNGPRGYIHVLDVSDIRHPHEVAYYRVPEAGSHNMWAEDDKLYVGYYQAGIRVVDISGELRGDLYRQGREIGRFMTEDANGTRPNATDTWGAQPYKGLIYASDPGSGLWVVEMEKGPSQVP